MKANINKILKIVFVLVLAGLVFELVYIRLYPASSQFRDQERLLETSESLTQNGRETPHHTSTSSVDAGQALCETDAEPDIVKQSVDEKSEVESILPETLDLEVPFICQAPLGDWNSPFKDACEEANILMVHYYFQGEKSIEPKVAAEEIKEIVDFEKKTYGFYESTSAEQTAQLVRDYYGYKAEVYYDISLEDIKEELAKGNLVIVPAAGRMLGNPYFTPPGPLYHMLLIKGYTQDKFIVNDAGTKRGADYTYSYQILEQALHDWNNGDVENRRSAMIIFIQK